jgi:hypothetical protein
VQILYSALHTFQHTTALHRFLPLLGHWEDENDDDVAEKEEEGEARGE